MVHTGNRNEILKLESGNAYYQQSLKIVQN
jgi:hypothetical protein